MSFKERKEALERKHLTASALIKGVLEKQAFQLGRILGATGFYFGGHITGAKVIEEDHEAGTYVATLEVTSWDRKTMGEHGRITFSNVRQGGAAFLERDLPYETDRTTEEAISMTCSNRADTEVTRSVSRDVEAGTVEATSKEDNISWDVRVKAEATVGVEGTASNWGATATATIGAEAGAGGNHTWGSTEETSSTITRSVADEFVIPGKTKLKVVGTFDKIKLRQDYRKYYPIDFDIEFSRRDFGVSKHDLIGMFYKDDDKNIHFDSIDAMISGYLGHPNLETADFAEGISELVQDDGRGEDVLGRLEEISDKNNRMIVQRGVLEYNDASDISIDVYKLGEYNDKGELIL